MKMCGSLPNSHTRTALPPTTTSMKRRCSSRTSTSSIFNENPTYIRPEDWREVDALIDWIIEKNKAGYQMVNSVQRLQEMKAFVRMSSGLDLNKYGWYGDGTGTNGDIASMLAALPGIAQDAGGDLHFTEWNCRAGQNNVIIRTDGTVAPCFPMYPSTFDWGNIDKPKFDQQAAQRDETDLPAALLFHSQSQSRLLLQRRARHQMDLETGGH